MIPLIVILNDDSWEKYFPLFKINDKSVPYWCYTLLIFFGLVITNNWKTMYKKREELPKHYSKVQ